MTFENLNEILESAPVVPLVQADDIKTAMAISDALLAGGLRVLEVVLRTDTAFDCLEAVTKKYPNLPVGAGTVLSAAQAEKAIAKGAKFIVSPGLNEGVVSTAKGHGLPVLPGVATATELQQAWNMNLRIVKFFPAGLAGGPKMIKALSSAFRDMRFMPTGGVNAANLSEYLSVPSVLACGGSWLTPKDAIAEGEFSELTELAREALQIALQTK